MRRLNGKHLLSVAVAFALSACGTSGGSGDTADDAGGTIDGNSSHDAGATGKGDGASVDGSAVDATGGGGDGGKGGDASAGADGSAAGDAATSSDSAIDEDPDSVNGHSSSQRLGADGWISKCVPQGSAIDSRSGGGAGGAIPRWTSIWSTSSTTATDPIVSSRSWKHLKVRRAALVLWLSKEYGPQSVLHSDRVTCIEGISRVRCADWQWGKRLREEVKTARIIVCPPGRLASSKQPTGSSSILAPESTSETASRSRAGCI